MKQDTNKLKFKITLRPKKGALSSSEVFFLARAVHVNQRGDLLVTANKNGLSPEIIACFASGSWLSAVHVEETPNG